MAGIEGEIHFASEIGLVGDTRLKGIAQLVGGGLGVVFVEVGTDDVDVGREVVAGMGFGVLLMGPAYLEVVAFLIVGGSFRANFVDGKTQGYRTVELVALVVTEGRLETP